MSDRHGQVLDPRELERLFQAPARLRIMAALMARGDSDFSELMELLQLTRGNLSVHTKTLSDSGFIQIDKAFVGNRPRTTYRVTVRGREGFARYVAMLEGIIASAKQGGNT